MKLQPYISAQDLPFGCDRATVRSALGPPPQQRTNSIDLLEWDYGWGVVRFNAADALVELTLAVDRIELGTVSVPLRHLDGFVRAHDPQAFGWASFLVSPWLGLAFDPSQPPWVTCFALGELAQWQAGGQQEHASL